MNDSRSLPSDGTLKYSWDWSTDVVFKFVERYARGTYFLAKMCEIPADQVIYYLTKALSSGNSVKFKAFKCMIKSFDSERFDDYKRLSRTERLNYLKYVKWMAEDAVLDEEISEI
jgi:hypothetical protein